MFKWQICYTQIPNLLQFTTNVPQNPTVNLSSLCNSCAKIACCSSGLVFKFLYAASNIQNASEQFVCCIHLSDVNFALHPTSQTKPNAVMSGDSNSCIWVIIHNLDTCSYELLFLIITVLSPLAPNTDPSSWITLYLTTLIKFRYFVDRASQYNLFFFISNLIHCFPSTYSICYPLSSTCFRPHMPIIRRSKLYMQPMVCSPSADVFVVRPLRKFLLNGRTTKTSAEGENTIGCMYNLDLVMMGLWGLKHVEERGYQILYVEGKTVYQVGNKGK